MSDTNSIEAHSEPTGLAADGKSTFPIPFSESSMPAAVSELPSEARTSSAFSSTWSIENTQTESSDATRVASTENQLVPISVPSAADEQKTSETGTLELVIHDAIGQPIPNLTFKVIVKQEVLFLGKTDSKGKIPPIEQLPLGSIFEIQIRKDNGDYKFAAIGRIEAADNFACLKSPKTKFEFSTYTHQGMPGRADQYKQETSQNHNQKPASRKEITGNIEKKPELKIDRDEKGNPKAIVAYGQRDWLDRNSLNAALSKTSSADLEHLHMLIPFLEKQAKWKHEEADCSDVIIRKMRAKVFKEPASKDPLKFIGSCNKYVKIALAYAEYGDNGKTVGSGISPAQLMGPELMQAGFKDVTSTLPKIRTLIGKEELEQVDITFSLPGDVIVYKEQAAPTRPGHIEIRTYHGFGSDAFWQRARNGFPDMRKYTVLGLYRQYSDAFAMARVKAFLKIIREKEAKGFSDPYRALKFDPSSRPNPFVTFDDMSKHPYADKGMDKPAGAYQIKWKTFDTTIKTMGWPSHFEPINQDRVAIYLLQGRRTGKTTDFPARTALGYVMEGKVEQAINDTKLWNEWACLPGGGRQAQLTMEEVKQKFEEYTRGYLK